MSLKIQIVVAAVIILALCLIINMIRKKALELKYTLIWLGVGIAVLILDIFPGIMEWLAALLGIQLPANMSFFFGFCFALMIIFSLTIAVSRMSIRISELAQEVALYEKGEKDKEREEKNEKMASCNASNGNVDIGI